MFVLFAQNITPLYGQQFAELIKEDSLQRERVLACTEFTYYGLDFSRYSLVNGKKIGTEEEVRPYFQSWIDQVNKYYVFDGNLSWYAGGRKAEDLQDAVQRLHLTRANDWITYTRKPIQLDSCRQIVKGYDLPQAKCEIGLVVIVEAMVKDSESSFTSFVFFDTNTREILWRLKYEAYNKNRGGMSGRWGDALKISYKECFNYWVREGKKFKKKN